VVLKRGYPDRILWVIRGSIAVVGSQLLLPAQYRRRGRGGTGGASAPTKIEESLGSRLHKLRGGLHGRLLGLHQRALAGGPDGDGAYYRLGGSGIPDRPGYLSKFEQNVFKNR